MTTDAQSAPNKGSAERSTLAVLMPAYNEQENIQAAVVEVQTEILNKLPNSYLLVVNDGSKDKTGEILDQLSANDPRVRVLHKSNSGHGPSLVAALNSANSDYVFLIDSDMQIPLDCFSEFWTMAQQPEIAGVFGVRSHRQDPAFRLFLSKVIGFTLSSLFAVKLVDANVPCKLIKTQIWKELFERVKDPNLMAPSLVITIYCQRHGYEIKSVPVKHRARTQGEPSLRIKKLMGFCWNAFGQVIRIRERIG